MNRSWAESDESAMLAVHRRYREVNESKIKFQVRFIDYDTWLELMKSGRCSQQQVQ